MQDFILVFRAIIKSPQGILIVQRSKADEYMPEKWEFPGGKFEEGSLKNNLKREIKEETGLIGVAFGGILIFKKIFEDGELEEYKNKKIVTLYIIGTKQKNYKVKLSQEYQNYRWIKNIDQVRGLELRPEVLNILHEIFN